MSTMIGLGIGVDRIRAVAVRRGSVRWAAEMEIGAGDPLDRAIAALLADAPLPRWRRMPAVAAVGPSAAQAKRIAGLPSITDPRALAKIVREGAGRFFLRNGKPLVTTGVRPVAAEEAWAAAFEEDAVRQVEAGCVAARLRLQAVVPTVAVLGTVFEGERLYWRDGDVVAELVYSDGRLQHARRHGGSRIPADVAPPDSPPALAALGNDAWRFADAVGAARLAPGEALVYRPGKTGEPGARTPAWRMAAAGAAVAGSALAAAVMPGLVAMKAEEEAGARLAALGPRWREAIEAESDLHRVTAGLAQAARFDAARLSMTFLLADLARALPKESAVAAFRIDTAGTANIVVLTPSVASVLSALERVPGFVSPEIVGPVTRELVASREVERAMIRFGVDVAERRRRGFEAGKERR